MSSSSRDLPPRRQRRGRSRQRGAPSTSSLGRLSVLPPADEQKVNHQLNTQVTPRPTHQSHHASRTRTSSGRGSRSRGRSTPRSRVFRRELPVPTQATVRRYLSASGLQDGASTRERPSLFSHMPRGSAPAKESSSDTDEDDEISSSDSFREDLYGRRRRGRRSRRRADTEDYEWGFYILQMIREKTQTVAAFVSIHSWNNRRHLMEAQSLAYAIDWFLRHGFSPSDLGVEILLRRFAAIWILEEGGIP